MISHALKLFYYKNVPLSKKNVNLKLILEKLNSNYFATTKLSLQSKFLDIKLQQVFGIVQSVPVIITRPLLDKFPGKPHIDRNNVLCWAAIVR